MSVHQSKLLSLVLRHKPEAIGVTMDAEGWVYVDELLSKMKDHGHNLSLADLNEIVETNNKKRFKFSADHKRIRANQGHSVNVDLKMEEKEPPDVLYHGTAHRFNESIGNTGITKQSRNHVHLSDNYDTAVTVGKRHGQVIVLLIDAKQMHDDGLKFFLSDNGVWLTDQIDPKYIQ